MQILEYKSKKRHLFNIPSSGLILLSFAVLILIGTFLLSLPAASRDRNALGFLDALFTATSAACLTGLKVVDTYSHFSIFGQIVILFLIQAGALGIVAFTTFFSILVGRKIGNKGRRIAQEQINQVSFDGVSKITKQIIFFTVILEILGAAMLSIRFIPVFGIKGIYLSVFQSISSFCNSGFDLMGALGAGDFKSFIYFRNDPFVLYTVGILAIVGGLGFIVCKDVIEYRKTRQLLFHTRVVLITTAGLITFGTVIYFFSEYNNLNTLNILTKLNIAAFQSISARTAGFSSIPIYGMNELSKVITILLMFIGGAPGSTAGGIKVTTFGIIIIAIISEIRGTGGAVIYKHKINQSIINRSIAIIGLGMAIITLITCIILSIENKPFIDMLFETTSAFGSAGLSTGVTPHLKIASKVLLILTMYIGKVGLVSSVISMTLRANNKKDNMIIPEGKITVG